jgi:hypothetical protein
MSRTVISRIHVAQLPSSGELVFYVLASEYPPLGGDARKHRATVDEIKTERATCLWQRSANRFAPRDSASGWQLDVDGGIDSAGNGAAIKQTYAIVPSGAISQRGQSVLLWRESR